MRIALNLICLVIIVASLISISDSRKSIEESKRILAELNFTPSILKKYPHASGLEEKDGKIIHPTYGEYQKEVEFYQGMSLMPGQITYTSEVIFVAGDNVIEMKQVPVKE